jgi:hypothetical protein
MDMQRLEDFAGELGIALRTLGIKAGDGSHRADAYVVPGSETVAVEADGEVFYVLLEDFTRDALIGVELVDTRTDPHGEVMPFADRQADGDFPADRTAAMLIAAELRKLMQSEAYA